MNLMKQTSRAKVFVHLKKRIANLVSGSELLPCKLAGPEAPSDQRAVLGRHRPCGHARSTAAETLPQTAAKHPPPPVHTFNGWSITQQNMPWHHCVQAAR